MSPYVNISDAEIEAYKPVRYRLMKRYGRNSKVLAHSTFHGLNMQLNDATSPGTPTTIDTFRIWVPDSYIGTDGTRLVVPATLSITTAGAGSASWLIEHDGDFGFGVITRVGAGSDSVDRTFTLDFSPTGNAYETINVQVSGTYIDTDFDWLLTQGGSYLCPIPR